MSAQLRFEISPEVIATDAQLDETLLMNTRTLAYFGLDPLGSKLWRVMQLTDRVDEVISQLALETGKSPDEVQPFVQTILSGMQRSGLISIEQIPASALQ